MPTLNTIVFRGVKTFVFANTQQAVKNKKMELADRIKKARIYAELTTEELAHRVGCSVDLIRKLEQGNRTGTTHIIKIARVCNVNADWLEDETGPMEKTLYATPGSIEQKVLAVMQPMTEYQKVQYLRIGNTLAEPSQEPNGKHSSQ